MVGIYEISGESGGERAAKSNATAEPSRARRAPPLPDKTWVRNGATTYAHGVDCDTDPDLGLKELCASATKSITIRD